MPHKNKLTKAELTIKIELLIIKKEEALRSENYDLAAKLMKDVNYYIDICNNLKD
jgi:hypothetical protein